MYCSINSEKSKRRTKTVAGTLEPKWNQTFIYSPMKRGDIENKSLEVTVYDYDRIGSGQYVGEVGILWCTVMLPCEIKTHSSECLNVAENESKLIARIF